MFLLVINGANHVHLNQENVLYCQIRGKKIFMAFDYRELGFFDMVFPHETVNNRLKRLPKNIKVKNYRNRRLFVYSTMDNARCTRI